MSEFNGQYGGFNGQYDPNGNYQNGYYENYGYMRRLEKKKNEKKKIRKLGLLTGGAILTNLLLQNVFIIALNVLGCYERYLDNPVFQIGADIIFSVSCMLVPFLLFGNAMKKEAGIEDFIRLNPSHDFILSLLAIPAGLCFCMAANIVTSYVVIFLEGFGITLSSPEIANPEGAFGFFLSVMRVSVVAALVEELAFRGCLMQPLRKFGDGFAVAMAACAFGLMHGNLIQAPFALISGLGLGYITVKCGTVWPAVAVHAINNFISTVASYALDSQMDERAVNLLYTLFVYGVVAVGGFCAFLFYMRAKRYNTNIAQDSVLQTKEKVSAYILNPTMLIAIAIMLYYTSQYIAAS